MRKSKPTVLHIINSLETGGAENVVVNLVNNLNSNLNLYVCCLEKIGVLSDKITADIPIYCLNKKNGNDYSIPFSLAKLIRHNRIDIIHSHNWEVFCEAVWAKKLSNATALIHTAHGNLDLHYSKNKYKKLLRHYVESMLMYDVDLVLAVSHIIKTQILSSFSLPRGKVLTIHNGVPCPVPRPVKQNKAHPECVNLISVGRLSPVKNYPMMIKAFDLAQKRVTVPIQFNIVGDGPEKQNLEDLVEKMALKDKVFFLGYRGDVEILLTQQDIYLNGSHYEGISLGILEAMNAGIPVIATSVGGNVETIENETHGMLVPDNNVDIMAEKIIELVEDPAKRKTYGTNGEKRIEEEFNLDTNIQQLIQCYQDVLI